MSRDQDYTIGIPSLEAITNPFSDFYPFESRDFIYRKCNDMISKNYTNITLKIQNLSASKSSLNLKFDLPQKYDIQSFNNLYGKKIAYDVRACLESRNTMVNYGF